MKHLVSADASSREVRMALRHLVADGPAPTRAGRSGTRVAGTFPRMVSIDFETANPSRGSACALGVGVVENGAVTLNRGWLIRPHPTCSRFDPRFVGIHGITASAVEHAADFGAVYPGVEPLLEGSLVIAHNASFDIGVLRSLLALYGIPAPPVHYLCTCMVARRTWTGLPNHKLDSVCRHIRHRLNHHDAADDALACARVMLAAMETLGVADPYELAKELNLGLKVL